ncbi:MAG: ribonuclease H-like YkuK family protein [Clostridiales bacterium]|nr:ribonuclease H-like YkuK family protein [Clostridiales bacterium]
MAFHSPSRGVLTFEGLFQDLSQFVHQDPEARYRLIVGTDSQLKEHVVTFVTAVVIHRQGKGARYYYQKHEEPAMRSLRQRIFYETSLSLKLAGELTQRLGDSAAAELDIEIHVDIGPNGDTRHLIREIVGMVTGSGYHVRIKPHSFGASAVADRHTK